MSLSVWQRNIVTEAGDVIPDAEIEVFFAGSSSKPSLFSDPDGNSSLTNPFNADTNGFARFYVSGGRYDIAVNGTVLWEDVALGTAQGRDTGTGSDEVPTNEDLPNSSSVGTESDHEDPEDKSRLARLDHIESALGIDTTGPAGENVLAAVGRGAIVESGSNSNGHYVRWENGEQIAWSDLLYDSGDSGNIPDGENEGVTWTLPASFAPGSALVSPVIMGAGGTTTIQVDASANLHAASERFPTDSAYISVANNSGNDRPVRLHAIARGFWK